MTRVTPNIELIVTIFTLLIATTASFLVRHNQVEQELLLHIWKATSLVIISLGFRFSLELITIKCKISHLRIFSPILFWILSVIIPVYILVLITAVGLTVFLKRKKINLRINNPLKYLTLSLLYFIIIGSETWNMHRHPLPDHYLITQTGTGSDLTFYAAITSMIKTHNICSTGIDGITGFPYHYGTYYFLSKISSLLDLNSLYVNHIIAPIIFLPVSLFFMIVFLQFCKKIITSFLRTSYQSLSYGDHLIFIAVLATLTNAPFGLPFVSNLSFFTSPFQIDSQLLGNIFVGIILILITYSKSDRKYENYLSFLLIIIFQTLVYLTKSPASHLSLFAIIYVLFRFFHKRSKEQNVLWILTSFSCLLITFYISGSIEQSVVNKSGILTLSFLSLWKNQVPIREWQWIFLSNGFYTFSSICILSYMCKKHSSYKTLTKFADSKFIFLELVTVLTLISICLTTVFGGALSFASTYYLDSIKFITLLFFAASLCVIFTRVDFKNKNFIVFFKSNSLIKLITCLCIAFLIVTGSGLSLKGWERTLNKYSDSDLRKIDDINSTKSKLEILQTLLSLSKHHKDKSHTCLWIPKSNTLFWNQLAEEKNEGFLPFWPVALSEMALIDGYPLTNKLNGHFGYGVYGNDDTHIHEKNLEEIKTKSLKLGFKNLIVLWDHSNYESFSLLNQ